MTFFQTATLGAGCATSALSSDKPPVFSFELWQVTQYCARTACGAAGECDGTGAIAGDLPACGAGDASIRPDIAATSIPVSHMNTDRRINDPPPTCRSSEKFITKLQLRQRVRLPSTNNSGGKPEVTQPVNCQKLL